MQKSLLRAATIGLMTVALFSTAIAQDSCDIVPDTIWTAISMNCDQTGRNEACYGNAQITVEGRTNDVMFEQVGDIILVDQIDSLTLSPLNDADQTWGVALLRLQATLPDTLPGQYVTVLAFGDVQIENAVQAASTPIMVTLTANGRMRRTPNTTSDVNVLTAVPAGTTLLGVGRDASGTWIYTEYEGTMGWISTQVLSSADDLLTLSALPDSPTLAAPMQAIYLRTGIGQPECQTVPDDGILIQTPQGMGEITLSINGVDVRMGSTLYLTADGPTLQVFVLEGIATVTALGESRVVPAGSTVSVPLNAERTEPAEIPSAPEPYDPARLVNLPVGTFQATASVLPQPITTSPPLSTTEIDAAVATYLSELGLQEGTYTITRVEAVVRNGSENCPPDATFTLVHDGSSDLLFGRYPRQTGGQFGDNTATLDAARNSDPSYRGEANQIILTSATTFSWFSVSNGDGSAAYCEFRYEGTRTGP